MKSEDIVLGILSEKPSSGYEIKQKFSTIFSNFYNASFGSVYPILHNLEKQGKVTSKLLPQEGKPNKKVYSITNKGVEAFMEFLQSSVEQEKIKWDFMVRLYYAKRLSAIEQKVLITEEIRRREQEVNTLNQLKREDWENKMDSFQLFSFELGIKQKQLMIDELKRLLENLRV
ncbi:PadR family transcriptional regulator [Enterococcus mundtii]|uniref:PadR family transcriptional regulator n=1 Tax=Enterococcus mundtii TaxID=53346 RepID=UPI002DB5EDDD|nr:PadR family transcriptional regulator [Enterococcus mundtii]EME8272221.1 PadR family transcriptional regulator [Enterococcus faecium]MEC3942473.1 PadR family transcriptional regulator [Enterococcus mundtii]